MSEFIAAALRQCMRQCLPNATSCYSLFSLLCLPIFAIRKSNTASSSIQSGTISVLTGSHLQLNLSKTARLSIVLCINDGFLSNTAPRLHPSFRFYVISTSEAQSRFEGACSSSYRSGLFSVAVSKVSPLSPSLAESPALANSNSLKSVHC